MVKNLNKYMFDQDTQYLYDNSNAYGDYTDNDHYISYGFDEGQIEPEDSVHYKENWNEGSNKEY